MKIATEYPGQTAIVAVTQQRHFHAIVSWDQWETKGKAVVSYDGTHPDPARGFADPCQWLISSVREAVCWWTKFDSFLGSQLFSHYTSPSWRAVSVVTRSAEQKPKGRGYKPIPSPGQSSRRWAGGWSGSGRVREEQRRMDQEEELGGWLISYQLCKGLWNSHSVPVEWQPLPTWAHTHSAALSSKGPWRPEGLELP